MVFAKKLLYSGNFNLEKDFVSKHLSFHLYQWIVATKWFFKKRSVLRIILKILRKNPQFLVLSNFIYQKYVNYGKTILLSVTFSQLLSNCNGTRTHNHLVCKWTLNHLAKLASLVKWLSVCLWTKWLLIRVPLQSLKLHILRLF